MTDQKKTKIFLSHKHEDHEEARYLKKVIGEYSADKIDIFLSEELQPGENWRKSLIKELNESDILILLFTNPAYTWDWCLFEAGMFCQKQAHNCIGEDKEQECHNECIVIIQPENLNPLPQFTELERIDGNEAGFRKFLNWIFKVNLSCCNKEAIHPNLGNDTIKKEAKKLSNVLFPNRTEEVFYERETGMYFSQECAEELQQRKVIPDEVIIKGDDSFFNIFGLTSRPPGSANWTWGLFKERIDSSCNELWKVLAENMVQALSGRVDLPIIQNTIRGKIDGNIFSPSLYKMEIMRGKITHFRVLFISRVSEHPSEHLPDYLEYIIPCLIFSRRYRFEVIIPYQKVFIVKPGDDKFEKLKHTIENIRAEAKEYDLYNEDELKKMFDCEQDIIRLDQIFKESLEKGEIIDKAIEKKDHSSIASTLDEMDKINRDFMIMASRRFHEILKEKL